MEENILLVLKKEDNCWTFFCDGNTIVTYYPITDNIKVHTLIRSFLLSKILLIIKLNNIAHETES